jgi:hypothetical protein
MRRRARWRTSRASCACVSRSEKRWEQELKAGVSVKVTAGDLAASDEERVGERAHKDDQGNSEAAREFTIKSS